MSNKTVISLRLNENLYSQIKEISEKELRSINAQIEYFILKSVEDYNKNNK